MFILHVIYYRISKRDECEMIMLIGLPGCGKTTWVSDIGQYPSLILLIKEYSQYVFLLIFFFIFLFAGEQICC